MEKTEIVNKLAELKAALYIVYKKYADIAQRATFDGEYAYVNEKVSEDLNPMQQTILQLKTIKCELPYPYENGKFDLLENFKAITGFKCKGIENYYDYKKMPWYSLLFRITRNSEKYFRILSGLDDRATFYGKNMQESFYDSLLNFCKSNINILKTQLAILDDIENNKKCPINKELKFSKKDIPNIRARIGGEILIQEDKIKKLSGDLKKNYEISVIEPRTELEIKDDNEMVKLLDNMVANLEKEYDFIKFADWKNIDGIIYMLDSGRADTLKEALNLLDQKIYADMIVGAIGDLNQNVCQRLTSLETNMNKNFTELFGKIDITNSQLKSINNSIIDLRDATLISSAVIAESINNSTRTLKRLSNNVIYGI